VIGKAKIFIDIRNSVSQVYRESLTILFTRYKKKWGGGGGKMGGKTLRFKIAKMKLASSEELKSYE
jgi:hypothetical protein